MIKYEFYEIILRKKKRYYSLKKLIENEYKHLKISAKITINIYANLYILTFYLY